VDLHPAEPRDKTTAQFNNHVEFKSKNLAPTAAGARSLHILDKSTFCQADGVTAGDDDVIQNSYIHQT